MQSIDCGLIIPTLLLWLFAKQGYGDHQLDRALHTIAVSRIRYDQPTRDYLARLLEQRRPTAS
ncbi:hypothetical protein BA895_13090 [Humibacillus sp. DSM 29435]|uniref:hypothetical protein n=1 Tax=Humibacillus sp. DSM 29435 TaxID=1869167 RepID=UPI00087224EF|nr:hypothetical protein [Humibacillus sp. DSM 29435]OFE18065.1 hypothetical protein BA895_13090 [Humibacillus sp. DSM 29435]